MEMIEDREVIRAKYWCDVALSQIDKPLVDSHATADEFLKEFDKRFFIPTAAAKDKNESDYVLDEKGFIFIDPETKTIKWCHLDEFGISRFSFRDKYGAWHYGRKATDDEMQLSWLIALPESEYKKFFK